MYTIVQGNVLYRMSVLSKNKPGYTIAWNSEFPLPAQIKQDRQVRVYVLRDLTYGHYRLKTEEIQVIVTYYGQIKMTMD